MKTFRVKKLKPVTVKAAEAKAAEQADMKKYTGTAASYNFSRPIRKVVKRSFNG